MNGKNGYFGLLRSSGFCGLLCAQSFGAFNDNAFKMVVSLLVVKAGISAGAGGGYLTLVGVLFIAPYLMFSGYAGHLADAVNKRTVLIVMKALEIGLMALALIALVSGELVFILGILFLMAAQSAFFSPAKYGILPELVPPEDISRANGLLEMTRYLAVIVGTASGGIIYAVWQDRPDWIGYVLMAMAGIGLLAGLGIGRVPDSIRSARFSLNPLAGLFNGAREVFRDRSLTITVMGITLFEAIGALLMLTILLLTKEQMHLDDFRTGLIGAFVGLGIALGCMAAGRLSRERIDLGLAPVGLLGVVIFTAVLSQSAWSYQLVVAVLILIGFSGGLFLVPLNSHLQDRAEREERGKVIGVNNFVNMGGVMLATGSLWVMRDLLDISAQGIILTISGFSAVVVGLMLTAMPEFRGWLSHPPLVKNLFIMTGKSRI